MQAASSGTARDTRNEVAGRCECAYWPPPRIDRDQVAAIAFTSGSTGEPQPQPKTWGSVVDGARAEVIALQLDDVRKRMDDVVLMGTVSPQHMYGFESTVLMALHGPCAFAAEHPLHPDEVIAAVVAYQRAARVNNAHPCICALWPNPRTRCPCWIVSSVRPPR